MKTIAFWAYPAVVLAGWLIFAVWTLSAVGTIQPSLRSIAAAGSRRAVPPPERPAPIAAARRGIHGT
jgi:hypothetical protein